ncbi:hypothetical protein Hanom_Chr17g01590871 [Helianthus anomalus]
MCDPKALVENPTTQDTGPIQIETVNSPAGGSVGGIHRESQVKTATDGGGGAGESSAATRKDKSGKKPRSPSWIRAEDMLGDIYCKAYDESRATEVHVPIAREWRTVYLEHSSWERHRERLAVEAKLFEQAQVKLQEEKVAFEKEKNSEEWGLQGLKLKLQASEDSLAEEHRKWRTTCENDNKKMYDARVEELKKYEADYKEKYEEAKSHRECIEVDLSAQIISKDRDLAGKDAKIAELKRRLREAQKGLDEEKQKTESLEINLITEKVKAETTEKVRKVSLMTLNAAQKDYAEVQSTVEPLISDLGWMQHHGVAHTDKVVAVLTMAAWAAGYRAEYVECVTHVEEAEEGLLRAEENYDNLSLPVMDMVTEALKHDDFVPRLRSIFEPQETVQLTDDEDDADDDGGE